MAQSGAANLIIILRRYVLPFHHKTNKLLEINLGGENHPTTPSCLHCPERYTLRWRERGFADRLRF
jgi:hypothetical protein